MSTHNLSSISPDKLFEESSISEIKTLQVKLKIEVEKKREELRTMVGERYRDLIEAADTISVMKSNSEKVIQHVDGMSAKCLELQEKHLLGFKLESNQCFSERFIKRKPFIMLAVQVKLLMVIPEEIWSAMDEEDYLLAAQLFLLARHVNTSLQFSSGEDYIDSRKVLTWFPVLVHQWNTTSLFRNYILNGCKGKLKLTDLTIESASSCLATSLLLEVCSLEAAEDMFLNLRMESLQNILANDAETSIKEQICQSLKLLAQTLYFRHVCFIEEENHDGKHSGNLVARKLNEIVGSETPKTFSILSVTNEHFHKYLPSIVKEFRPSWSPDKAAKSTRNSDERLTQWLDSVKTFLQEKLVSLLELVTSIKGLYAIREGAWEVLSRSENKIVASSLPTGMENGGLWEVLIRPLVTSRAIQLISSSLERALDDLKSALLESISTAGFSRGNSVSNSEYNIDWYIWKEWPQDLYVAETPFIESKDNTSQLNGWMLTSSRSQKTPSGLEMKAKGYSPVVQKLCRNFDSHFEYLLEDFMWYVSGDKDLTTAKVATAPPFNKFIDRGELKQQLQSKTFECIKSLITFVKEEVLKSSPDDQHGDTVEAGAVVVGRFLMGLMELCPQLQKCMCPSNIGDSKASYGIMRSGLETNCWVEACHLLVELSTESLRVWRKAAGKRMHLRVKRSLTIPPSSVDLLRLLPAWDHVTIEEGPEEGQSIKSTIRVPCHPSFALHSVLFASCQEINGLTPHTLPSKIHQELIEDLAQSLLENYEPICTQENIPQVQALQFFFDVEYIIHLFLGRDNKVLMERARKICDKMKTFIDPFDYDVFYPHIMKNIKASVRKTQTLLGVALSQDKIVALSRASSQGGKENAPPEPKDPSIMPLPTPAPPCLPLLPLSYSGATQRMSPGREKAGITMLAEKTGKKVGKPSSMQSTSAQKKGSSEQASSSGLIARSGAFFGAMGSDWF
ncbi:conserved oligomeric Golgi complex subunit 1 [Ischnura elegans]|uniref:conserved oligomeric Golgi complex subunit 1 n=1 Tax=Ischnura elegans TaxID=197161 RepID=UPI001ED88936|nr:conserved oligomeric Golgi complex subunit 1 [Ischnura elegans]